MIEQQEIPKNWNINLLGDFIQSNGEFLTDGDWIEKDDMNENGRIAIVQLGQIKRGKLLFDDVSKYITEEWAEENNCTIAESGDIIISRMSPVLGGATVPENTDDFVVPVDAMVARGLESPTREYLLHYLNSPYSIQFGEHMSKGATRTRVSQSDARELPVPVPPLDEQERVVEALEERLGRVKRLIKSVENIGMFSDEYYKSLLKFLLYDKELDLTTGIGSIPSESDVPDEWEVTNISEVTQDMNTGSTPRRSDDENWGGEVKWIKAGEISSASKYVEDTEEKVTEEASINVYGEDYVFVTIIGSNLGCVALPTVEMGMNQQNVSVKLIDKVDREYFYHYIRSIEDNLKTLGRGGGQQAINQTVIGNVKIPVPPLEKQKMIVDAIESVDNERIKRGVSDVDGLLEEYKNSLLAHAFRANIEY